MTPLLAAVAAVLVLLAQAAWIRRTFVVVTVAGRSMAPTFEPGDRVPRQEVPALAAVPESTVPPGKMVLLGDAPESSDSRQLGYFDAERLVGRVVRRMSRA